MTTINKFLWELAQENEEQYLVYSDMLSEFKKTEEKLLEELQSKKCLPRDLLKYRNKLNKLLANIPPFLIEEYDFLSNYKNEVEGG